MSCNLISALNAHNITGIVSEVPAELEGIIWACRP